MVSARAWPSGLRNNKEPALAYLEGFRSFNARIVPKELLKVIITDEKGIIVRASEAVFGSRRQFDDFGMHFHVFNGTIVGKLR